MNNNIKDYAKLFLGIVIIIALIIIAVKMAVVVAKVILFLIGIVLAIYIIKKGVDFFKNKEN